MFQQCHLVELQPQPVLCIRTRTPQSQLPGVLGESYKKIAEYLAALGELPAGAPYVAYFNMDMDDLDIEIGFPVSKALPAAGTVKPGEIAAGKYGATTFTGPYQEMSAAYEAMTLWMQVHKYEPTGIVYEIYLNDPAQVIPQELQTQILFPLK